MIVKLRRQFEEIKQKKRHVFDDFDGIVSKCYKHYAYLFPNRSVNKDGSRVVYHSGVDDVPAISLEKEHGAREYVPRYYAKLAMSGIEDLLNFVENSPSHEGPPDNGGDSGLEGERDEK